MNNNKREEDNIFTFDEDPDEIHETIQYQNPYQYNINTLSAEEKELQSKYHTYTPHNSQEIICNDIKKEDHPQRDIFLFEDDDLEIEAVEDKNEDNLSHNKNVVCLENKERVSLCEYERKELVEKEVSDKFVCLKNQILFKEENNYMNPKENNHQSSGVTTNSINQENKINSSSSKEDKNTFENKNKIKNTSFTPLPNKNNTESNSNQNFEQFQEKESLNETYSIQGAKIRSPQSNLSQKFEYLEEQKAIKVNNLKQFLFTQLSHEYKVNLLIKKTHQDGFLTKFVNKTKYFVTIEENNKFLFSITKDGFNKFIFSLNKDDISTKNKNYLGQLISQDLSNSEFLLFDYGFDPKETKSLEFTHKQLAWIKYEETSGPRKFNVTISTNNQGFHSIENDVNVIEKKWVQKKDRKHLAKVYSKEPELDEIDGNFKLDFKGMIGKPSVKNFILSSEEFEDCLIFARRTDDTYALEVRNPFSLIQAAAVCMSSIYYKSVF